MSRPAVAAAVVAILAIAAGGGSSAFERDIDITRIERALAIAQARDPSTIQRFHDAYTIRLGGPLLDKLEVITELRRVVLAAQERRSFGDPTFGARQAADFLSPYRNTVTLVLDVTFPPQNVYRAMPEFRIVLYGREQGTAIGAREVRSSARYVAGQLAPPGSPILGGRVEATFDATRLDARGIYLAGIVEQGRELRRVEIDFGRIE